MYKINKLTTCEGTERLLTTVTDLWLSVYKIFSSSTNNSTTAYEVHIRVQRVTRKKSYLKDKSFTESSQKLLRSF